MFHIMVPAGAQPGKRFVFPSEGDESTVRKPPACWLTRLRPRGRLSVLTARLASQVRLSCVGADNIWFAYDAQTMEAGDVVFVLRDATPPHDVFLRRGQKDIVFQGARVETGQVQNPSRLHARIDFCAEAFCHLRLCVACACLYACRLSSARFSNISREFRTQ